MLRIARSTAQLAALFLSVAAPGCGNSSSDNGDMASAGDMATPPDMAPVLAHPPAAGPLNAADGTTSVTFAISKVFYGDTNRDGTPNQAAGWKQYGYDLDGKASNAASTDLCTPRNNAAPKFVYPDGNDGIDNAFGKNILPLFLGIASDAPMKSNDAIATGKWTRLFDLRKLGSGTDYNPLPASVYYGSELGGAPRFDGSDAWPVMPETLNDPSDRSQGSKLVFAAGYVTGNTFVGVGGSLEVPFQFGGSPLLLPIDGAIVVFKMDAAHKNAIGTIAGVMKTEVFTTRFKKTGGYIDPSLCAGPTLDSITAQIEQASDILADGTQDPSKACDGISIGLGFEARVVQLGAIATPAQPSPDPCP